MNRFFLLLSVAFLFCLPAAAQFQLPDPGFEDWSGTPFDGKIQPKYWNYCNVVQFGFKFNFAERAAGRSGYCIYVKDQDMKVMGINGGTSPGYVALGQPWAYVPALTKINKATAGCSGGISFTHRPDSVVCWIKRTGPRWADENYNIVFYAWRGTAHGTGYLNKGGGCTEYEQDDEESDIRQALNPNICTTSKQATEVCEAYLFERKEYRNWTRIAIPVYYFSDAAPTKCNLILSSGHYPAGRANTGQFHGNGLYVDDVELVYTSLIQKVVINGTEWRGFDPNNHDVQTCQVAAGTQQLPTISCIRGAGSLKNYAGKSARFPGRKLTDKECSIDTAGAAIDGKPVTITVTSEDGRSTSTYKIRFVSK